MGNIVDKNIRTNIKDFYKLVGESANKLVKEGVVTPEDLDNLVQLSAQRAVVDSSSRIISPCILLAIYGGYKFFAVGHGIETQIVFFGAIASIILAFVATMVLAKILTVREKLGCLLSIVFGTAELVVLFYSGYLLFYRGLFYPFFGPDGMSWGGFGMALVFLICGSMISKATLAFSIIERAVTHKGIELVVEKLKESRQGMREFMKEKAEF